jgi:hypothetical protein
MIGSLRARSTAGATVSMLAMVCLLVTGCNQTMQPEDPVTLTASERQLRDQVRSQRIKQGATTGAVVGGVGGAGIGLAIDRASGGSGVAGLLIGAAAGIIAGAAAGAAYGAYVDAQAQHYANDGVRAEALMAESAKDVAHYQRINASAVAILSEEQTTISRLNAEYKARSVTKDEFRKKMRAIDNDQKLMKQQISAMDAQIAMMEKDRQAPALQSQIDQLKQQRAALQATYDRLLQLYGTVPAEVKDTNV